MSTSIALHPSISLYFFFNDPATTEIYTLSLHDALPISLRPSPLRLRRLRLPSPPRLPPRSPLPLRPRRDRKSTRLNSSHTVISYAVFCLKKKKMKTANAPTYSAKALADAHSPSSANNQS